VDASVVVFKPSVLQPGVSYLFNCTVFDSTDQVGWGAIQVDVARRPISGRLTIQPPTGKAAVDIFDIKMVGWTTEPEDFPLTYSFRFEYSPTGRIEYPRSPDNQILTTLPQPNQIPQVAVVGTVYGNSGASSSVSRLVSVESCVPTNLQELQEIISGYRSRVATLRLLGQLRETRTYILAVSACLTGGFSAKVFFLPPIPTIKNKGK